MVDGTSELRETPRQDTIKGFLRQEDTLWIAASPFVSYSNQDNPIPIFGLRTAWRQGTSLRASVMMKPAKASLTCCVASTSMLVSTTGSSKPGPQYQPIWRRNGRP